MTDKVASLQCKVRKVIASESQSDQSPKIWIGSDGENVLKLLSELMQVVTELSGTASTGLKKRLDPIIK